MKSNNTRGQILAIDIETVADPDCIELLPEPEPAGNLKDPEKIAADIEKKREKQRADMGLVPVQNMIVAIGWASGETLEGGNLVLHRGKSERDLLERFWDLCEVMQPSFYATFNGINFDIPTLNLHSLRHGVKPARMIDCGRYRVTNHIDCRAILGNWDSYAKGTQDYYARWLGVSEGKLGVCGADVQDMWDSRLVDEIGAYAQRDAADILLMAEKIKSFYNL